MSEARQPAMRSDFGHYNAKIRISGRNSTVKFGEAVVDDIGQSS